MYSYSKRIFCLLMALSVFVAGFTVSAEGEAPWEKFGFEENYQYSNEMIGHALKSTVPMIEHYYEAKVTYKPIIFDSQTFFNDVSVYYTYLAEQGYSEDDISSVIYDHMAENIKDYITYGRSKTMDASCGGTGSGVVLSEDGYIATNAHVARMDEESKKSSYIYALSKGVMEELQKIADDVGEYGVELSEEDIMYLSELLVEDAAKEARIKDETDILIVNFPTASGDTSYDNCVSHEAELVTIGTQENKKGLTQDMALLKIDAENLVSLKLSETYPETNSEIFSGGFPGSSETIFNNYGSTASVLSVSVTPGTITRVVRLDDTDYQPIQISSTISNGSSGGPSVDESLAVEGLNTYGLSDDMRFAYMVPAAFLKDKSDDVDFVYSDATKSFLTGLQMLQEGYGSSAKECFEYVRKLQPDTPYIENLIDISEKAPQKGHETVAGDSEGTSFLKENILLIAVGAGAVLVIVAVIILLVNGKKKRGKDPDVYSVVTHEPPKREDPPAPPKKEQEPPARPTVTSTVNPRSTASTPPSQPEKNEFFKRPDDL